MLRTRQTTEISLVGNAKAEICGNQLPSNKQVLEYYYYYTRHVTPKLSARKAAMCVVRKCAVFWEYAGIPIVKECHAIGTQNKHPQRRRFNKQFPNGFHEKSLFSMSFEKLVRYCSSEAS